MRLISLKNKRKKEGLRNVAEEAPSRTKKVKKKKAARG